MQLTTQQLCDAYARALKNGASHSEVESKRLFLASLKCDLGSLAPTNMKNRSKVNWMMDLLAPDVETWPIDISRSDFKELSRVVEALKGAKIDTAVSLISDAIWRTVSVTAGNCNECMGEEFVYWWSPQQGKLVRVCDLCGHTPDMHGESAGLVPANRVQVVACVGGVARPEE